MSDDQISLHHFPLEDILTDYRRLFVFAAKPALETLNVSAILQSLYSFPRGIPENLFLQNGKIKINRYRNHIDFNLFNSHLTI